MDDGNNAFTKVLVAKNEILIEVFSNAVGRIGKSKCNTSDVLSNDQKLSPLLKGIWKIRRQ